MRYLIFFFVFNFFSLGGEEVMGFLLSSPVLHDGEKIEKKYTCDGRNVSPPLKWEGAPKGTQSFVLIVDDPDAPRGVWTHWVVYNIPGDITEIKEGEVPVGALEALNDFGKVEYGGPCPPSGTHRYYFKLYALDNKLTLPANPTRKQVEEAMKTHILSETQLMTPYSRG
jgi:Raf kinase inhibitor-like YbhB/YbcL family protein